MAAIGLLMALLLCWAALADAQKTAVFVTASFQDRNRLYIENLSRDEIRVSENGQVREVGYFAGTEVPVAYGLIFDRALLPEPFEDARPDQYNIPSAAAAFNVAYQILDLCLGRQIGWVATYDDQGMKTALDFSQDSSRVKDAIQQLRARRTLVESFLYGPLFEAVQKMSQRHEKRRVLVLFLDTLDMKTADKLKPLKNLLSASNVEFFVASFATRLGTSRGLPPAQSEASLRELTGATAGGAYFRYTESIEGMGRRISEQIRTFYTIGFESYSPPNQPGTLTIECTRPGAKVKTHPVVPTLQ